MPSLSIKEAARTLNVTSDMLRNWECNGLLRVSREPRTGHRRYGSADLDRLRIIRMLRQAGYGVIAILEVDATLSGSETALAATAGEEEDELGTEHVPPEEGSADDARPLLVVVDGRGRFRKWRRMLQSPWWRSGVALCSRATPENHLAFLERNDVDRIITGDDRVDLRAALAELAARHGVRTIRVDSGGALNGALLRSGLVDEVSVLVEPCLVGGTSPRSIFTAPDLASTDGVIPLRLTHLEKVRESLVWLRYEVEK